MEMTSDQRLCSELLMGFIGEMNLWERQCNENRKNLSLDNFDRRSLNEEALVKIFKDFCTPRDRPYGRISALSYQRPPEYDAGKERISKVSTISKGVQIETCVDGEDYPLRYTFRKSEGVWRIDKKEIFYDKWERFSL